MDESKDVVADAATPCIKGLMLELNVKTARMYELLSKDNPYPKVWRILRAIGRLNPDGLRLVQADFNARCESILCEVDKPIITGAKLHKELSEALSAYLSKLPLDAQRREITEALSILNVRMSELNAEARGLKAVSK